MALLFLKGVRMGSPMRALAITLPEKMTSMDESHRDRGCFREKVNPAAKHTRIITFEFDKAPVQNVQREAKHLGPGCQLNWLKNRMKNCLKNRLKNHLRFPILGKHQKWVV